MNFTNAIRLADDFKKPFNELVEAITTQSKKKCAGEPGQHIYRELEYHNELKALASEYLFMCKQYNRLNKQYIDKSNEAYMLNSKIVNMQKVKKELGEMAETLREIGFKPVLEGSPAYSNGKFTIIMFTPNSLALWEGINFMKDYSNIKEVENDVKTWGV